MSVSAGRRFMIDLLVSSLMADGGLESALSAAITAEIQVRALKQMINPVLCYLSMWLIFALIRPVEKPAVNFRKKRRQR